MLKSVILQAVDREVADGAFAAQTLLEMPLSDYEFVRVHFSRCTFSDCDFTRTSFYDCTFDSCSFENCRFEKGYFRTCRFSGCKFLGGSMILTKMKSVRMENCAARYLTAAQGVWVKCTLSDTALRDGSLNNMKLDKCVFSGASFTQTELFETSFAGMDLTSCEFSGITLGESLREFRGAKINALQAVLLAQLLGAIVE